MSAQLKDADELKDATERDLLDLWQPKRKTLIVNGMRVHIRALTVEERARCERIETPTQHDALALSVAMGCIKASGEPLFGPFAEALDKVKRLEPKGMLEIAQEIFLLSGMGKEQAKAAEGN